MVTGPGPGSERPEAYILLGPHLKEKKNKNTKLGTSEYVLFRI